MEKQMGSIEKLSILIPVFNEARTVAQLLDKVVAVPLPCAREIIVVDDGSTDGSTEVLEAFRKNHPEIVLLRHDTNQGKGAAIRTAIKKTTGDWTIIQDADLEYDPQDYERLMAPVMEGVADAVFGSRFLVGRYAHAMYFWHYRINKLLTLCANMAADLTLTDVETGYKLMRTEILKSLILVSSGFDIEPELTIKLARWGARIYEVPISYRGRTYIEGKKIRKRDAFRAFLAVVKYQFFTSRYSQDHGFLVLQAMREARKFNRWLFAQFAQWLGDTVLEAGCGIGNLTEFVLDRKRLVCVDKEAAYVDKLRRMYGHLANVRFAVADIRDAALLRSATEGLPIDSLFCINVVEHVADDVSVLRSLCDVLIPGGRAIILVPNNPALYTKLDEAIGHARRYTRLDIQSKMEQAGFNVISCRGFNRLGALGWRINGKIFRKKTLSIGQIKTFELLLPLARVLEHIPFHCHNSLICIGKKPPAQGKANV